MDAMSLAAGCSLFAVLVGTGYAGPDLPRLSEGFGNENRDGQNYWGLRETCFRILVNLLVQREQLMVPVVIQERHPIAIWSCIQMCGKRIKLSEYLPPPT